MFSKAMIAGLFGLAAAYTKPVGPEPVGNPIAQPGLNSIVPVGTGFTITWNPTTKGTVSLVLLKGPSENAVPQYAIVEKTENDGTYVWTPSTDLEPTEGAKGYGIQLIDDATGQYQYTTQFGISNPGYKKGGEKAPSHEEKTPATGEKPPAYSSSSSGSKTVEQPTGHETMTAPVYSTKSAPYATGNSAPAPKPTGHWTASQNVTMVAPTGYKPTTVSTKTSPDATNTAPAATYEGPAQQTGAASNVAISFFGFAAAAGAAVLAI